jgi:hypothetical protein
VAPPALAILGVVKSVELVGIAIQAIGSLLGLVVVLAVVASGRLLLSTLANDVQLLAGVLHNLFQRLLKIHSFAPVR